jgi:pimeloyl-ACP methyl ester carboxylesterase
MTFAKKRLRTPAGEFAFVDEGEGPALLLLHGFPTSAHLWRDLVPILAPRFRVLAPDLLGYGDSGKPPDPQALTIRSQAAAMRELLSQLEIEDIAIVGHDIGGGVAQLLALEREPNTLVLIDTISFDSWPIEGVRMLQTARDDQVDEGFVRGVVGMALELGMSEPKRLPEEDLDELLRPWLAEPHALIRAARSIDGEGLVGTEERLGQVEARTLVLWGEDDPYQPAENAERLGEIMPGATVALIPGASHYVTEDAPEVVLPLIAEYLRVHSLGASHDHHAGPTAVQLGISFERPDKPSPPVGFEDLG